MRWTKRDYPDGVPKDESRRHRHVASAALDEDCQVPAVMTLRSEPSVEVRCSACAATYTDEQWRLLQVGPEVSDQELRRNVRFWPREIVIEVRRCSRCGHLIPAKRRTTTSP